MRSETKNARSLRWAIPLAVIGGMVVITSASVVYFVFSGNRGSGQLPLPTRNLTIGGASVVAEVASSAEEKRQGLSNRRALPPDGGMIFPVYPSGRPAFWMKEMTFPLDFIYLSQGAVAEIKENVSPSSFPGLLFPSTDVDAVLEVSAGWAARHGIRVGDAASY